MANYFDLLGAENAAAFNARMLQKFNSDTSATNETMDRIVANLSTLVTNATSLEQLRADFTAAVAKANVPAGGNQAANEARNKALAWFSGVLTNATSLEQFRKDFAARVAMDRVRVSDSFLTRKYAGVPVWGWGAIGVGGTGLLALILRLLFRRR